MTNITNRLLLIFAIIGLIVSLYLSYSTLSGIPVKCSLLSGCQIVEQSSYSRVFGIPVAVFGVLFYLTLIIGVFMRVDKKYQSLITKYMLYITTLGFLFSVYLTYLELYVIHAICMYCVISAIASTSLFFISMYENIKEYKND